MIRPHSSRPDQAHGDLAIGRTSGLYASQRPCRGSRSGGPEKGPEWRCYSWRRLPDRQGGAIETTRPPP